jgi:ankyrin repeat protein
MSDRKASLPPLQRLSVGTPRTGPNPLEVLDQDALLQIRNALIDVDAPKSVCEKWNLWCSVSKAAREHLDMCTNPDDGSWQEACRLLGLVEKPASPWEEEKTWRQWLRRLCAMASSLQKYSMIGYYWYRKLCRELRTEERFKNELPGMNPPHRWRLRCAGELWHNVVRTIPDAWRVANTRRHYRLMRSLCLQFGDADALEATREWGPKLDNMFLPKTDPNEPGFLEGKMERREYAIAAGADVDKLLLAAYPMIPGRYDLGPGLRFLFGFTECWSDKEALYVPDIESVRMLIDAGAVLRPQYIDQGVYTPAEHLRVGAYTLLMHAAWAGDVALCDLLLERGADINAIAYFDDRNGGFKATALLFAVRNALDGRGDALGTMRTLLARNPVLTALDPARTVLAYWARHSLRAHPEDVARVMEAGLLLARHAGGVMLNQQNAKGQTPLHIVVAHKTEYVESDDNVRNFMVPMLLDEGADVSLRDQYGCTPLIDAVGTGVLTGFDGMGLLIRASVEAGVLDAQDLEGKTALLHVAVGSEDMSQLLDAGADPNVPDNEGKTLLHYLAAEPYPSIVTYEDVEALLDAGADPNVIDKEGWTPARYAGSKGHKDMFRLLLEHGAEGVDGREFFDDWSESGARRMSRPW